MKTKTVFTHIIMEVLDMLKELKAILVKAAGADTAYDSDLYRKLKSQKKLKSSLELHCGAVASVVQSIVGGEIVTGKINGITHYWNRLPDKVEIDLTSCQFGGDGFSPLKKGRLVVRKNVNPRFKLFTERVNKIKDKK